MLSFQTIWDFLTQNIFPHAPALVYCFGFAFLGELAKRYLWTESRIRSLMATRDGLWNRGGIRRIPAVILKLVIATPFPLHPAIAGALLACLPVPVSVGVSGDFLTRQIYVFGCAMGSLSLYDIVHSLARSRGLDFRLPGEAGPAITPDGEGLK